MLCWVMSVNPKEPQQQQKQDELARLDPQLSRGKKETMFLILVSQTPSTSLLRRSDSECLADGPNLQNVKYLGQCKCF